MNCSCKYMPCTCGCKENIEGKKDDDGKLRWDLLPISVIKAVIQVLTHGAEKYGEFNWQKVEPHKTRYYNATMRHITQWWEGEKNDKDTKLHHLAHAICCLLFLIWRDKK